MSATSTNKIFEAELIDHDQINPFASPGAQTTVEIDPLIGPGIGRASPGEIRLVVRSLMASEVTYLMLWCAWLALIVWPSALTVWIWIGMVMIAWGCFARMVSSHGDFDLVAFATIFSFPVPVFGLLIFFTSRQQACRFLVWNGYNADILGASPDYDEIRAMNADPSYRPSAKWRRNGSKRSRSVSFNLASIAFLLFLISIALVATTT